MWEIAGQKGWINFMILAPYLTKVFLKRITMFNEIDFSKIDTLAHRLRMIQSVSIIIWRSWLDGYFERSRNWTPYHLLSADVWVSDE